MVEEILLFAGVAFAALLVHSFAGFGSALVAMPLLSMLVSPKVAIPSFALMILVMDVALVVETRAHVDWRRVGWLLLGALAGVPLGVFALKALPADHVRLGINSLVLLFAILLWCNVRLPVPDNRRTQLLVGTTSGLLGGWFGTSGPPIVLFGLARKWTKDAFRGTLLAYFTGLTVITLTGYGMAGLVDGRTFVRGGAALAGALPAAWIGIALKKRVSQERFRQIVLAVITLVAIVGLALQLREWLSAPAGS